MPRERKALKRISNRKLPQKKRLSDYSKNIGTTGKSVWIS